MYIAQIGGKLRAQIKEFSGKLSPGFSKPTRKFIGKMIYGILASQDVKLSQISRALEESISIKKTEDRISVNLNREGLGEELLKQIAHLGSRRVHQDTLLIIDTSDIRKNYARKMQYLTKVRDGSTHEICEGYSLIDVIAGSAGGEKIVPLYQSLYSTEAPEFTSQNDQILKAVKLISTESKGRGIWVGDRGFDRNNIIKPLLENKLRFIVRMVGNRGLVFRGQNRETLALAKGCPSWYRETIVKETRGREKTYHLQYGFRKVRLPGRVEDLWLVVVRGFGKKPMMLLTNLPMRKNRSVLWFVINGYLTRWRIEEAIRFIKQSYNLEDIRVLTYRRLCNLIVLVLATSYFAAVFLGESLKLAVLTRRVLKAAKRFYGIASFRYYAIADGISYVLRRTPNHVLRTTLITKRSPQLTFSLDL